MPDFYGDQGSGAEHPTPDDIFDAADREFGPFTLDPATALGYHSSNVILARGGDIITPDHHWFGGALPLLEHTPRRGFDCASCDGDGLAHEWTGRVWLNHPYGREDWRWIKKARDSVREGDAEIVCALVPVKPQMRWWQRYVIREFGSVYTMNDDGSDKQREVYQDDLPIYMATMAADRPDPADLVRFVPGRIRFGDSTTGPEPYSAPFASALVVWRK